MGFDLKKLVDLKRQETELLGYDEHPYDALLDQFEPGAKTSARPRENMA